MHDMPVPLGLPPAGLPDPWYVQLSCVPHQPLFPVQSLGALYPVLAHLRTIYLVILLYYSLYFVKHLLMRVSEQHIR